MKKKIIINLFLTVMIAVNAQVGINTNNPLGIFHVANPLVAANANDVVVSTTGNIGFGVTSPSAKFDIASAPDRGFRLVDGTEENGKALVLDNTGRGYWEYASLQIREGAINDNGVLLSRALGAPVPPTTDNRFVNITSSDLVLDRGTWVIFVKMTAYCEAETGYYTWITLRNMTSSIDEITTGIAPGTASDPDDSRYYSTSQLSYQVSLTTDNVVFRCYGFNSAASTGVKYRPTYTSGKYGSYFYAIRVGN